jgi:hypothetical protein
MNRFSPKEFISYVHHLLDPPGLLGSVKETLDIHGVLEPAIVNMIKERNGDINSGMLVLQVINTEIKLNDKKLIKFLDSNKETNLKDLYLKLGKHPRQMYAHHIINNLFL